MVEVCDKKGKVIRRGQNLAVLRRYIGQTWKDYRVNRHPIRVIIKRYDDYRAQFGVFFADGAFCITSFQDHTVCRENLKRWRSLAGVNRMFEGEFGITTITYNERGKPAVKAFRLTHRDRSEACDHCNTMILYEPGYRSGLNFYHKACVYRMFNNASSFHCIADQCPAQICVKEHCNAWKQIEG